MRYLDVGCGAGSDVVLAVARGLALPGSVVERKDRLLCCAGGCLCLGRSVWWCRMRRFAWIFRSCPCPGAACVAGARSEPEGIGSRECVSEVDGLG